MVSTPLVEMTSLSAMGTPVAIVVLDGAQEAVELAVTLGDRVAVGAAQLGGRELLPLEQAGRLLGGQPQGVDYSRHGGTRNWFS